MVARDGRFAKLAGSWLVGYGFVVDRTQSSPLIRVYILQKAWAGLRGAQALAFMGLSFLLCLEEGYRLSYELTKKR